ncbi:dihydrofolate reductase family protein [Cryptosporangium minutisporangium]|uniref:RibD family protein n=1 Tax=Cryptosporangium minutisporangium TaxID=113569 RepID=A0ABP6SQZ6_9ACTN
MSELPHVVVHVAVSLEGATTGFELDLARFYALAQTWREDVTLVGADTILAQEAALATVPKPGPAENGPLLAVVDSCARVHSWRALRDAGHWSGVLALRAASTPKGAAESSERLVVGAERVDLRAALAALAGRGASTVRVDSGGALTGALLAQGLLDEVSLLVHPVFAGHGGHHRWFGPSHPPARAFTLAGNETIGDLVWLRYRASG